MNSHVLTQMRSEQPCYGTWLSLGSSVGAELAAQCGFDWLLIDMEHGAVSEASVLPLLQAVGPRPVATIVRVPSHDRSLIARVLDWGADGIMVPHVSTSEEARILVRAMRYPPEGTRGYSRTVRAYGYGLRPAGEDVPPLLFVQIECASGIRNVDQIASVDGVDVVFVGPADLQLSLSSEPEGPGYEESLGRVAAAARQYNRHAGILIRNSTDTKKLLQQGFTKVAIGSDISMLRSEFLRAAVKC